MGGQANGIAQGLSAFPIKEFFGVQGVILEAHFKVQMRGAVAYSCAATRAYAVSRFDVLIGADPNVIQMSVIGLHAIGVANDDEFAVSAGVVLCIANPPFVDAVDGVADLQGDVQAFVQLATTRTKGRHNGPVVGLVKMSGCVKIQTDLKRVASLYGLADVGEKIGIAPTL